jgi:hypothetical protein
MGVAKSSPSWTLALNSVILHLAAAKFSAAHAFQRPQMVAIVFVPTGKTLTRPLVPQHAAVLTLGVEPVPKRFKQVVDTAQVWHQLPACVTPRVTTL